MSFGGKGSSSEPQTVTSSTSQLPEWAEPYYHDIMQRGAYESSVPYTPYQGQRLAYFSPMEQEAMARYGELGVSGTPPELNAAGQIAYGVSQGWNPGINSNVYSTYSPGAAPNIGQYYPERRDSGYVAGDLGFNYDPFMRRSGYTASEFDWQNPDNQYLAGYRDVGFDPGSLADKDVLQPYMDPYYQNVVDVEKREAERQAEIARKRIGLSAAGAGSLGGYREGIEQAENERNTAQLMGDIQTRGSQEAFRNAQQAFIEDRAGRAQLEQFMQSQFGLNEQAKQRAVELMQMGYGLNEAARQAQEELAQSQYGRNQQALQQRESLLQSRYGLTEGARQTQEQLMQSQFGMNQGDQLGWGQLQLSAWNAYENAKQQAASLGLTADQIEQAGQIAAAQVRLNQNQNQLASAGMLGDFAGQRQQMEYDRLQQMLLSGMMEREMAQRGLDMGYQDFLRQQAYPRESLAYLSNLLYGAPIQAGQTVSTYGSQPSDWQQMAGLGVAALGLWNAYNDAGG